MIGEPREPRIVPRGQLATIERALSADRCVVLVGPPEVGKSKLAEAIIGRSAVPTTLIKLDNVAARESLRNNLDQIANNTGRLLVLDGVHLLPECLVYVRAQCDRYRQSKEDVGQYLLLGAAPVTRKLYTDHLATRCEAVELTPIHLLELTAVRDAPTDGVLEVEAETSNAVPLEPFATASELWIRGGFPGSLWNDAAGSRTWRERYLLACYDREIPGLNPALGVADIAEFFRRISIQHASEYRLKHHLPPDLRMCVSHFEKAGLVRRIMPWQYPINEEESPYPKIFIRDSGLFHAIRNLWTLDDVRAAGCIGASWEGFCVENLVSAAGRKAFASHFRASEAQLKDEVDLILQIGKTLVVVECKFGLGSLKPGFHRICDALQPALRMAIRDVGAPYVRDGVLHINLQGGVQEIRTIADNEALAM